VFLEKNGIARIEETGPRTRAILATPLPLFTDETTQLPYLQGD
jgi:hypothetical protein